MWKFEKLRICGIPFLPFQMKDRGGLLYKLYKEVWGMNAPSSSDFLQQRAGKQGSILLCAIHAVVSTCFD